MDFQVETAFFLAGIQWSILIRAVMLYEEDKKCYSPYGFFIEAPSCGAAAGAMSVFGDGDDPTTEWEERYNN